ncbi:MAG: metallophosphoesterase [Pseudomonadota bacterium]
MKTLLSRCLLLLLAFVAATATAGDGGIDDLQRHPAPTRLIAIGDIHGDCDALTAALRLGGAIDGDARWIGGELWVVQTGDYLDRGPDELKIIRLLDRLEEDAARAGGRVIVLNANHEIVNVDWIFRYATDAGFAAFRGMAGLALDDPKVAALPEARRHRAAAFMPGGPMARRLADHSIYAIVGDTVFVHAGISPEHVAYGLERIVAEMRNWMRGKKGPCPAVLKGSSAPVWMRDYSRLDGPADCEQLARTLNLLGVSRMVVGHTVQEHINPACEGRVWRIDTGMSRHFGGPVEVLEITPDGVRALQ